MSQDIAQTSPKLRAILLPSLEYQDYIHEPRIHQFVVVCVVCADACVRRPAWVAGVFLYYDPPHCSDRQPVPLNLTS